MFDEFECKPLHKAVIVNDVNKVIDLIQGDCSLDDKYDLSFSPLHLAAIAKNLNCMLLLLQAGAKINLRNINGRTALHFCAYYGFAEGIELLIKYNADPNIIDSAGCTPLHLSIVNGDIVCIKKLITANAFLEVYDFAGQGILHDAARNDLIKVTRYLLMEQNLNDELSKKNRFAQTPIDVAQGTTSEYLKLYILCINKKCPENFLEKYLNFDKEFKYYIIELLIRFNCLDWLPDSFVQKIFIEVKNKLNNSTYIFYETLMKSGDIKYITINISRFTEENERNNIDNTGKNLLHIAAKTNCIAVIDKCINEWNLNFSQLCDEGIAPLHVASMLGHFDFAQYLFELIPSIRRRSFLLEKTSDKKSTLHLLTQCDNVDFFIFIQRNLPTDEFLSLLDGDNAGNTVIHYCILNNAIKILSKIIEDKNIKRLISQDLINMAGYTPQHLAAITGNLECIEIIRSANPNFSVTDYTGNSPLHLAVENNHLHLVKYFVNILKVNLNRQNNNKETPYQVAMRKKLISITNIINNQALSDEEPNQMSLVQSYPSFNNIHIPFSQRRSDKKLPIHSLTFKGGGVKGIAYCGAIKRLIDKHYLDLNSVKQVAGTSAGAITALLLSLGYSIDECFEELSKLNFNQLIEDKHKDFVFALKDGDYNSLVGKNLYGLSRDLLSSERNGFEKFASFVTRFGHAIHEGIEFKDTLFDVLGTLNSNFGIFNGNILLEKFEEWIERKTDNKYLTFKQLEDLVTQHKRNQLGQTYKSLYVIGYCLNSSNNLQVFSAETTPDDIISHAVRISMSIPIFFTPHKRHIKNNDSGQISRIEDALYVDGGLAKNNPFDIFDNAKYFSNQNINKSLYNPYVLNFKLISPDEAKYYLAKPSSVNNLNEIDSFFNYIRMLIKSIMNVEEANYKLRSINNERTILINTKDIGTIDFNLDKNKQEILIEEGENGAEDFINNSNNAHKFNLSYDMIIHIKDALRNDVNGLELQIFYSIELEYLCKAEIIKSHGLSLIYKLARIPNIDDEAFELLLYHFRLNLCRLDSFYNNVAHLLAAEGNVSGLELIYKIKPSLFLQKNSESKTPIAIFYDYHKKSNPGLLQQFLNFYKTKEEYIRKEAEHYDDIFKAENQESGLNSAYTKFGIFRVLDPLTSFRDLSNNNKNSNSYTNNNL